ncbi:hypothetical protein MMC34_003548 [Xylographa carneopallida]|nr:hypothetical protein [Xylographa carneopallida]
MTSVSALQTPDILVPILTFLDPTTLAIFRLTSTRVNSIVVTHQTSICNSIALRTYSIPLDFLPSPNSLLLVPGLANLHIKTLLRIPRARRLADRAIAGSHALRIAGFHALRRGLTPMDSPANREKLARCTQGILVFWALIDIQDTVSHVQIPKPHYTPEASIALGLVNKRWKHAKQIFSPRTWVSTLKLPSSSPQALNPVLRTADTPSTKVNGYIITPADLSAASVAQQFAAVKAAQAPFVALLARPTRVDLEVAQGLLHGLLPSTYSSPLPNSPLYTAQNSWWRESWAVRQGPAFMLSVSSEYSDERVWARAMMEQEFKARSREVVEVERTTPIFLFEDKEMGKEGVKPLWAEAWDVRSGR